MADPGRIQSISRFSEIVEILCEREAITSRELADEMEISKSTAHAYLATMEDLEYAVRTPEGYSLSLKFLDYGMIERDRIRVVDVARNTLEQLAEDTSEATYLVVEEHGQAVYVDHVLGNRGVQTHARLGTRMPLHTLASGKAILAYLSDERIKEILDTHGLPEQTANTITARETLYEKLEMTRERGYAVNEQEANVGTRAVGAPVLVDGNVIASIAVAGPANRITRTRLKDEVAGKVLAAANEIEIMLQR